MWFCYVYWVMLNTCIMHLLCSVASSLYNVDTASRAIYQEREKKVIWSTLKPLGKVCKFIDLSWFDDSGIKCMKMAMWLNSKLQGQVSAATHGRCTPGLPQFLNHTCQIVKTSGSAGGWITCGSKWVLLSACSGGWFLLCEGSDVWVARSWRGDRRGQPLMDDQMDAQTWESRCLLELTISVHGCQHYKNWKHMY